MDLPGVAQKQTTIPQEVGLMIDEVQVKERYNSAPEIWPKDDKWHNYTHARIADYIAAFYKKHKVDNNTRILNAGSGGITYGLPDANMIHMDVADAKICHLPHYIVGSVESIPLEDNSIDLCICVGSVVNYCVAEKVIGEIQRVVRPGGTMVLEFETSHSLDLIGTKAYKKGTTLIETFYDHRREVLWVYSEEYMDQLLKKNGFHSRNVKYIHIIAPLIYKLTHNADSAANFTFLDGLLHYIPVLRNHCSNIILTCEKE